MPCMILKKKCHYPNVTLILNKLFSVFPASLTLILISVSTKINQSIALETEIHIQSISSNNNSGIYRKFRLKLTLYFVTIVGKQTSIWYPELTTVTDLDHNLVFAAFLAPGLL